MNIDTTIDFTGFKDIEIISSGRERYRFTVILSKTGDVYKLAPFIFVKGEEGKTIEKNLNSLYYVKNS